MGTESSPVPGPGLRPVEKSTRWREVDSEEPQEFDRRGTVSLTDGFSFTNLGERREREGGVILWLYHNPFHKLLDISLKSPVVAELYTLKRNDQWKI